MSTAQTAAPRLTLPIGLLIESRTNPRKVFNPAELAEMAESMKNPAVGVIQPLIIRPAHKGKHEIVAGAKRFRAAKLAGLAEVPISISEANDATVLEMQLIENLQRSDPHPLEEAEGFVALMKLPNYNADVIAAKIGKDRSYVYKRIQLTELIEPLKGKFLDAKIHIGHALQLCRLQESDQIMVAKEGLFYGHGADREAQSVDRLRDFIERHVFLKLSSAPWDKADAELLPAAGSCISCTKRTGANLVLFDDIAKDDRCLDRKCFHAKEGALVQLSIAKAGEKGIELVKVAIGYMERNKKHAKGVLVQGQFEIAVKSKCAKPQSAIVVAGDDTGRKLQICTTRGCKQHGGYRSTPRTKADIWKDKERALDHEIDDQVNQRVALAIIGKIEKIGEHETRQIAKDMIDHLGEDDLKFLAGACGFDIAEAAQKKRTWRDNPLMKAIAGQMAAASPKTIARLAVGALALSVVHDKERREDFEHVYRVDRKKITAAAGSELRKAFKAQRSAAMAKAQPTAGKKAKGAK